MEELRVQMVYWGLTPVKEKRWQQDWTWEPQTMRQSWRISANLVEAPEQRWEEPSVTRNGKALVLLPLAVTRLGPWCKEYDQEWKVKGLKSWKPSANATLVAGQHIVSWRGMCTAHLYVCHNNLQIINKNILITLESWSSKRWAPYLRDIASLLAVSQQLAPTSRWWKPGPTELSPSLLCFLPCIHSAWANGTAVTWCPIISRILL